MSDLGSFRRQLDVLDEQITQLMGERFAVCREIAHFKREQGIPMMQPDRVVLVRQRYLTRGAAAKLPPGFSEALFDIVIEATCRMEDELIASPHASHTAEQA